MVRKGGGDLVSGGWRVEGEGDWPGANWRIGLYSVRSCLIDDRMVFFDHTLSVHKFGTEVCTYVHMYGVSRGNHVCVYDVLVRSMCCTCIIHTVYLEELVVSGWGGRERERDRKPDDMIWSISSDVLRTLIFLFQNSSSANNKKRGRNPLTMWGCAMGILN